MVKEPGEYFFVPIIWLFLSLCVCFFPVCVFVPIFGQEKTLSIQVLLSVLFCPLQFLNCIHAHVDVDVPISTVWKSDLLALFGLLLSLQLWLDAAFSRRLK